MDFKDKLNKLSEKIKSWTLALHERGKYGLYKLLESGLPSKLLFFAVVNLLLFLVLAIIYLVVIGKTRGIDFWQTLRLFVNSNSILQRVSPFGGASVFLLVIECLGTIFFSGLIISIITNFIIQKVDSIKEGHFHYKLKNHVVIIGYDTIVPSILSELLNNERYAKSKFILQTSSSVEEIRNDLLSKLSKEEMKRVLLVHAPRLSVEELKLLYTTSAKEIFIVGERKLSDHDAENMYTFETLVEIHSESCSTTIIPLTIWFENEASYAALQLNDISGDWKKHFEFRPYNFYKRWANRLLTNSDYGKGTKRIDYPELDHEGIADQSNKHVHLIIVGMNRMGIALAKEAAHMMHFPNFNEETGDNRTRITFIDDHADREMNFFIGRHAGYFDIAPTKYADLSECYFREWDEDAKCNNFLDIQFEFIKGRMESKYVRDWITKQLAEKDAIITIALCVHNPSQNFGMAMYLPEEVYTRGRNDVQNPWAVVDPDQVVNIFVRQEKTGALIKTFGDAAKSENAKNKKYANLHPFGMIDDSFSVKDDSNKMAMAFNYIYDYYIDNNHTLPSILPKYDSLKELWKTLSTSHKWSNLYLADSIEFKLRSIGLDKESAKSATFSKEQIERMAYTEHCRWNMEKLLMGYRALGEKERGKSLNLKLLKDNMFVHYLIKPYADLTEGEKELDRNFITKLPDILRMLDQNKEDGDRKN